MPYATLLATCVEPNIGAAVRNRFQPRCAADIFQVRQFAALRLLLEDPIIPTGIVQSVTVTEGLLHADHYTSKRRYCGTGHFSFPVHKLNVNVKIPF
jgi:hypothetical protein